MSSRLLVEETVWDDEENKFNCIVGFHNGTDFVNQTGTIKKIKDSMPARKLAAVQFGYSMFLSKSVAYAMFLAILVWKFKPAKEKKLLEEN
ncbi:M1-specific T cell receptor beta chain-like [Astyanax mexicanus]|nr:M1-specific T cell receptor beta chain-like [Astyanax mexicanus]